MPALLSLIHTYQAVVVAFVGTVVVSTYVARSRGCFIRRLWSSTSAVLQKEVLLIALRKLYAYFLFSAKLAIVFQQCASRGVCGRFPSYRSRFFSFVITVPVIIYQSCAPGWGFCPFLFGTFRLWFSSFLSGMICDRLPNLCSRGLFLLQSFRTVQARFCSSF